MAYMSQERKAEIAVELKKVMPHGWKYSLGVHHHSTIRLTIRQAPVDLVAEWNRQSSTEFRPEHIPFSPATGHIQVNEFYLERQFDKHLKLFKAIKETMNVGNHDRSDSMTDYFDVGWYVSINIGEWDKPFVFTGTKPVAEDINERIAALTEEQNRLLKQLA